MLRATKFEYGLDYLISSQAPQSWTRLYRERFWCLAWLGLFFDWCVSESQEMFTTYLLLVVVCSHFWSCKTHHSSKLSLFPSGLSADLDMFQAPWIGRCLASSQVTHFNDPQVIAEVSEDLGEAMTGINCDGLVTRFADREGGNMPAAKKPRMESGDTKGLAGTAFWGPRWPGALKK